MMHIYFGKRKILEKKSYTLGIIYMMHIFFKKKFFRKIFYTQGTIYLMQIYLEKGKILEIKDVIH